MIKNLSLHQIKIVLQYHDAGTKLKKITNRTFPISFAFLKHEVPIDANNDCEAFGVRATHREATEHTKRSSEYYWVFQL